MEKIAVAVSPEMFTTMMRLLREADELYTHYGLIAAPPDGMDGQYPIYPGQLDAGKWIGEVRKITRG